MNKIAPNMYQYHEKMSAVGKKSLKINARKKPTPPLKLATL